MDPNSVIKALAALAQEHRLAVYRLLVQAGPEGMPAGILADRIGVPPSSMSFHLAQLANAGLVTQRRQSRSIIYSWDEFAGPDALVKDFVFTVCDNAAGEACPVWPGQPMTAHWGIEDPAAVEGTDIEKQTAFNLAFRYMKSRISLLLATPIARLDKLALTHRLREIGETDDSSQIKGREYDERSNSLMR